MPADGQLVMEDPSDEAILADNVRHPLIGAEPKPAADPVKLA